MNPQFTHMMVQAHQYDLHQAAYRHNRYHEPGTRVRSRGRWLRPGAILRRRRTATAPVTAQPATSH
jgi:hypothetical protein